MRKLADILGISTEALSGSPKTKKLTIDLPPEISTHVNQVVEETGKTFEEVISEMIELGIRKFAEDPEFAAKVAKGIEARRQADSKK
nr:hypothetical protein [Pseudomonas ekonensis]